MNEPIKIKDVLADPTHEAHAVATTFMEKVSTGRISMCGCLGAMYCEPYCPCKMEREGLQHVMDNNPLRKAAEYDSAQQWKKFIAKGGFEQLTRNHNNGT